MVGLRQVREHWVQGITSWPLSTQRGAGMGAGRAEPLRAAGSPRSCREAQGGGPCHCSVPGGVTPVNECALQEASPSRGRPHSRPQSPGDLRLRLAGNMDFLSLCSSLAPEHRPVCAAEFAVCLHPGLDARTAARKAERGPRKTLPVMGATRKRPKWSELTCSDPGNQPKACSSLWRVVFCFSIKKIN